MRRVALPRVRGWLLAGLMVCAAGCGDGLPRQPVSGRISVDGKPLDSGWIEFVPVQVSGITSAASQVSGGAYGVSRSEGLVPGEYSVRITSGESRVVPLNELPGGVLPQPRERIPARYNTESTLTAKVSESGSNAIDFDLSTTQPK